MSTEWIVIETFAVLIENFLKVFFLNRQLPRKHASHIPITVLWFFLVGWGLFATFAAINQAIYDIAAVVILFAGTYLIANATLPRKLFTVFLITALSFTVALTGTGVVSLITERSFNHTLYNQDASRLLAIILVKMLQVAVFLSISRKRPFKFNVSRAPALVLIPTALLCLAIEFLLWVYISSSLATVDHSGIIVAAAVCSLFILIGVFQMYDLFAKLERRNIELSKKEQRAAIEITFQNEIKNMHADLQKWRHEYKNNLIVLRGYVESEDFPGALDYIDGLAGAQLIGKPMIRTDNAALDAIINSKLWLAEKRGINVSAQSAFPESGVVRVTDGDLCSIIGNLMDNSIEACDRMPEGAQKFITFELLVRENNLFLSIYNSFAGKISRDGEEYMSSKSRPHGGVGIKYVDSILARYEGYAMREYNNGVFATQVMIPLLEPRGDYKRVARHRWFHRILGKRRFDPRRG
jgi:hypothetical protein